MMIRSIVATCVVIGSTASAFAVRNRTSPLPFYCDSTMTPEWLSDRQASTDAMHRVGSFKFSDQHGDTLTEHVLDGHVSIIHFFFTRCGDVCPTTTSNLSKLLARLPSSSQLQILSHSVMPDSDSVESLQRYATTHHIVDPRWHLLTGKRADVERLAKDSYFVRLGDGSTYGVATIAHTESILLVDGCGRLRGVYAGTLMLDVERLREDAITLLGEPCRPASH